MDVDVFCFLEGTSSFFAGFRDQGHIFFVTWSNLGKLRTLQDGHHSINVDSYNVLYYIYIYTHPLRIPKKCGG